jgi:stage II sporulation protein D
VNNLREPKTVRWRRAAAWAVVATSVAGSVAVAAPVASTAAGAPMAASPYGSEVVFDGHGFGHGIGLSQYGALGYALAGWQWTSILNHYYGGTNAGTIGNDLMSVRLTALDGQGQTTVV